MSKVLNSKPLVSVIIPSYNSARFLRETIFSVLNQTYNNIEIVVVDDGSIDNTKEICSVFGNRINYLYQNNAGVSAARNNGFIKSKGEYVCFLDADDWVYPTNFEKKLEAFLITKNENIGLVHCIVELTNENLEKTGELLKGKSGYVLNDLLNLIPPAIPCPSNALIKREVLESVGLFDVDLSTSADYDLWLRISEKYEVLRIDDCLLKYRQHGTNMFGNIDLQVHDLNLIFEKYRELFGEKYSYITKRRFYYSIAASYLKKLKIIKCIKFTLLYMYFEMLGILSK